MPTQDNEIHVRVTVGGGFTNADARQAIDGATITPQQVGTSTDPVNETYTDELSVNQSLIVPSVPTANDLPADTDSVDTQVMFVESEQRYYRFDTEA